jgi:hypothetical protein
MGIEKGKKIKVTPIASSISKFAITSVQAGTRTQNLQFRRLTRSPLRYVDMTYLRPLLESNWRLPSVFR